MSEVNTNGKPEKARLKTYRGEHINVTFDKKKCCHLAYCLKNLPSVFNLNARPWINLNHSDEAEVIKAVNACPSGALQYTEHADAYVSVEIAPNGPLNFRGILKVKPNFNAVVAPQSRVSLCRCGLSKNKPYCDASHRKNFKDAGLIDKKPMAVTQHAPASQVDIVCVENGPLMCKGNVQMTDAKGEQHTVIDAVLCRCGASKRKPFCDGSHNKIQLENKV